MSAVLICPICQKPLVDLRSEGFGIVHKEFGNVFCRYGIVERNKRSGDE